MAVGRTSQAGIQNPMSKGVKWRASFRRNGFSGDVSFFTWKYSRGPRAGKRRAVKSPVFRMIAVRAAPKKRLAFLSVLLAKAKRSARVRPENRVPRERRS